MHTKTFRADIHFLHETHLKKKKKTAQRCLKPAWASHEYQSNFTTKARGVAILFRKNFPFIYKQTISDQNGRYIVVQGIINQIPVTLVNLCGPNFDDPSFFTKVIEAIPNLQDTNVITGDFNCVLDPALDRQLSQLTVSKSCTTINSYIKNLNIVDIWRVLHPSDRNYSFFLICAQILFKN